MNHSSLFPHLSSKVPLETRRRFFTRSGHLLGSAALATLVAGCALTLIAGYFTGQSVEDRTAARFHELATARAERLALEFERHDDDLTAAASRIS